MKKAKKKSNFIILTLIIISFFIIPTIGIYLFNNNYRNNNPETILNSNSLQSSLKKQTNSIHLNLERDINFETSKFDDLLKEFLLSLSLTQTNYPSEFMPSVRKIRRMNLPTTGGSST